MHMGESILEVLANQFIAFPQLEELCRLKRKHLTFSIGVLGYEEVDG